MVTCFIAVSSSNHGIGGEWGRGATEAEALTQCRKAGAKKNDRTTIYRNERPDHRAAEEFAPYVDGGGSVAYYGTNTKVAEYVKGKRVAL